MVRILNKLITIIIQFVGQGLVKLFSYPKLKFVPSPSKHEIYFYNNQHYSNSKLQSKYVEMSMANIMI